MQRRSLGLLGAAVITASGVWLACGGSGSSDLVTPPADVPETGSPTPPAANDAAVAADAASGDAAAAADADAGPPGPQGGDGGSPPDAGPGGSTTVLTCGSTSCAIPTQACCVTTTGGGGGTTAYGCAASCAPPDAGVVDTTALKCSEQANCGPGTVCCVRQLNPGGAASECKATCAGNEAQLCSLTAATSGCTGTTCSNSNIRDWGLPTTYATCGGKGN